MSSKIKKITLGGLFFLNLFLWQMLFGWQEVPLLKVILFDVGQGDAIFIELPSATKNPFKNRVQVLIDGGPSFGLSEKLAQEMPFFDRKIELLIPTHPHKDHITGLFEILEDWKVGKVLIPKIENEDLKERELYRNFKNLLEKRGVEYFFAKRGQKISFEKMANPVRNREFLNGANLFILWPKEDFNSNNIDEFSIVGKFSFGEIDFLFTGDLPKRIELWLLSQNLLLEESESSLNNIQDFLLESEILKVSHHGSKSSTGEYFLKEVGPAIASISVGKDNPYGHPHQEVLEILEKYDIKILRTDKNGKIEIISDGKNYQAITER